MKIKKIKVNGIEIAYRETGTQNKETIVLLHGFPSSSHMYRDVMENLSKDYHLIAPDYPGFGLSEALPTDKFEYTFDNLSSIIESFLDTLELSFFYLLMQDYGGPVGFRIATRKPHYIKGLIIQNANMYMEGAGEWIQKIGEYQQANDLDGLDHFKNYLMSPEGIKEQYVSGSKHPEKINPISYNTDIKFIEREGINEIQTALFYNYGTNFEKYPEWQNYLKTNQPPTLVVWGDSDKFFSKPGGEAYRKDLKTPEIHFFEGGHFMLEEYSTEVAGLIRNFITRQNKIKGENTMYKLADNLS